MPSKPGKTLNNDIENALETSYPKTCDRLAILLSVCPTDLEREFTAQQHLFPDYAQMRAHIVTVINNRTRGPGPMRMGNLNDWASNREAVATNSWEVKMENCTV